MKSFLRKQSISLKCLVITLLLSFIGQAVALPDVCTMQQMDTSNAGSTSGMDETLSAQAKDDKPCHGMNMTKEAEQRSVADLKPASMDCCDSPMMADSSCSCPDSGCSGSVSFFSQSITDLFSYSEHISYYTQPRFPSQINSALFRPPIA